MSDYEFRPKVDVVALFRYRYWLVEIGVLTNAAVLYFRFPFFPVRKVEIDRRRDRVETDFLN